ncbi:MAG: DUF3343 domain-containing protein [Clostridia bacterium]|nr:DUF3343 domain-containing protein [Clostridia bacterium]
MSMMIEVGSVSNAMRGKRILEQRGVRAYVRRRAPSENEEGCGYGLLIPASEPRAVTWLKEGGVRVIRVRERESG